MLRSPSGATPLFLSFVSLVALGGPAFGQGADQAVALPDIVVTADRRPEPIGRSASAITVVTREELQSFNPTNLVDALRSVPGLDISDTGGPGSTTVVRLRGANTGQTLVLIDGIRVNDPTSASGEFDFSNLLPTAIDRIEVLRGPQSALYGSDAIGGVVNIITKAGGGQPNLEARTEGGSYGTFNSSATAAGSIGPWSYAFSGGGQTSNGFSRFGYRIPQLERRFGKFEADGFTRWGGYGRIGYDAGEGVKLEMGIMSFRTFSEYDAGSSTLPRNIVSTGNSRIFPDTPAETTRTLTQIWSKGTAEQGPLTHTLQVYANQTDREFRDYTFRANPVRVTSEALTEFRGDRVGTEYQGDLRLESFGTLTFGGRFESEKATTFSTSYVPGPTVRMRTLEAEQDTRSVFALYQLPIGDRIILSAGGRHDEVNRLSFDTWRATGAFLIPETGTKLRATGGTGGKAPTLYQLFHPTFGNPGLMPETSIGWDAGIDQTFWDGRLTMSATVFGNRFQDMIEFDSPTSRYFNVSRAKTSGLELEGALLLWPELLKLTGNYTYLDAVDERTNLTLQRRPPHLGRIGLGITPMPRLLIEPRVTMVSQRFSGNGETLPLAPYARLDIYGEYRFDSTWKIFGRIENITDARYQEVLNYGTTGRAVYAGLSVTW
jgi:vitamin B12 transporter